MGYIFEKSMLPVIVIMVLWKNTDRNNWMTLDEIVDEVFEIYEPGNQIQRKSFKRMIAKLLNDLRRLFGVYEIYENVELPIGINYVREKIMEGARVTVNKYCLSRRLFSEEELRLLCDSILFSPGISRDNADLMFGKIQQLAPKTFNNIFRLISHSDIIHRTNNEEIFENIRVLSEGITGRRRVRFIYKNTDERVISPYYLVISRSHYYVIGYQEGHKEFAHCRLDRIKKAGLLDERSIAIDQIGWNRHRPFNISVYMKEHPRMYWGRPVRLALLVDKEMLDAVSQEFNIVRMRFRLESQKYHVCISTPPLAAVNWVINTPDTVKIIDDNGSGVIDMLRSKARDLLEVYEEEKVL